MLLEDDDTLPTEDQVVVDAHHVHVAEWSAATTVGHVREANEDAWGQHDHLYVVADGMGGHDGGTLAATTAVEEVLAETSPADWSSHVATVNRRVRAVCERSGLPGAGTTLVAVQVRPDRITVVSAGDSRVYRLRDGDIEVLTSDHNVGTDMLSAGVDAEQRRRQGVRVGGLTSFVGIAPGRLRVDVTDVDVLDGDRLVLASDGIHGQLSDPSIAALLGHGHARRAADSLVRAADDAGGRDNATAVVMLMATNRGA